MNIYDLEFRTSNGTTVKLSDFKGKTLLIVNTATKCGLTPQFQGLQKLHESYKDKGLVVIGFPCNQFLSQEPESNETMAETCEINHGVTFQLTEKINVNGKNAHPVFKYLKSELGSWLGSRIKWNFTKFLVSPEGKPLLRFSPKTVPSEMEADIQKVLKV